MSNLSRFFKRDDPKAVEDAWADRPVDIGESAANRTLTNLIGTTVSRCVIVVECGGSRLPGGTKHWGSALFIETDDGKMKFAVIPDGRGFKFVLQNDYAKGDTK